MSPTATTAEIADPAGGVIPKVGHIGALDGLRGLAVLAVMLYHQNDFAPASGLERFVSGLIQQGAAGVDLFFVLSGFLITGILIESRGAPHYARNFYARRFLRIFPLYYAVLFLALVVLPVAAPSMQKAKWAHATGWNQLWYWSYLSNWYIGVATDGPTHGIVDLSWTLSIEEQFYLVWPWVVAYCGRRGLLAWCGGLIVGSLAFRVAVVLGGAPLTWAMFLTPARLDSLGVGAAIALLAKEGRDVSRLVGPSRPIFLVALAATAALAVGPYHVRVMLAATAYAALFGAALVLAVAASPGSLVGRFLGGGFLAMLGRYSYALYLFHNPIQALVRDRVISVPKLAATGLGNLAAQALFSAVTTAMALGLALLSWRFFEGPILSLKKYFPSGRGAAAGGAEARGPAVLAGAAGGGEASGR